MRSVRESGSRRTFYPNGRSDPDPINTVEHISIPYPIPDSYYTVIVKGTRIPLQHQHFALVISGPFDSNKVVKTASGKIATS